MAEVVEAGADVDADVGAEVDAGMAGAGDVVERAVALLDGIEGRPVSEHVEVFDRVHRTLQDALATLNEV